MAPSANALLMVLCCDNTASVQRRMGWGTKRGGKKKEPHGDAQASRLYDSGLHYCVRYLTFEQLFSVRMAPRDRFLALQFVSGK